MPLVVLGSALCSTSGSAVDFPLHVSADGRRLLDAAERPFLLQGDAAWSLMVVPTKEEVEIYLEDRRLKGFNTVLVNLIERGFGGPANAEGELPFIPADDYTSPNPSYFAHADWVIERAAEKGILVLLTPSYLGSGCGSQGWCDQMLGQPVSAMLSYGQFLGVRYASKRNVLWVHGGDTGASVNGVDARVNAIVAGISAYARDSLHTAHCSRNSSAIDCYSEPWLDLNTTYSTCADSLDAVRRDYAETPAQAFFYIEGNYENEAATFGCLIDQAAWSVMSGAVGHVFGNNPIWKFATGWPSALNSPGSRAMSQLALLFNSRAWFRLEPDRTGQVLVAGAGADAAAARTVDGESVMVYVPSARALSVDLTALSGTQVRAWWFDPVDGRTSSLGVFPATGVSSFAAPGRRVLVLDDAARGLAAPGAEPYDADDDSVADVDDNCRLLPNADQRDTGGVGIASPDGIGDACQCGDVNDSGAVTATDGLAISRASLNQQPFSGTNFATLSQLAPSVFLAGKCDVNGSVSCNSTDSLLVNRVSLGIPPPVRQLCLGEVIP